MARPTTSKAPPAGYAGARDDARTEAVDDGPPGGPDGGDDGFVFVGPEVAEASADEP